MENNLSYLKFHYCLVYSSSDRILNILSCTYSNDFKPENLFLISCMILPFITIDRFINWLHSDQVAHWREWTNFGECPRVATVIFLCMNMGDEKNFLFLKFAKMGQNDSIQLYVTAGQQWWKQTFVWFLFVLSL